MSDEYSPLPARLTAQPGPAEDLPTTGQPEPADGPADSSAAGRSAVSPLDGLDEAQRRAASALEGPVRILAVAGAGKTRTITRRIAYGCLEGGWDPERVAAITFSVRAAREMRSRLGRLGVGTVRTETFHALALSQLRSAWSEVSDLPFPQLADLPAELVEASVESETNLGGASPHELRDLLAEINWTKVGLIRPEDYTQVCESLGRLPPAGLSPTQMAAVISGYERVKSGRNLIDFNDILLILTHLIEQSEEVSNRVRSSIGWLTVDEYQDVSPLQHRMMRAWLGSNANVCVVGDPAQTIYSFAGATSYYLLDFDQEFGGLSADIRLDRDYRSTPQIVTVANRVLAASPLAEDYVSLRSEQAKGLPVARQVYQSDEQEAAAVAGAIRHLIGQGVSPDQIAVLSRINSQLRLIRQACDQQDIPYLVRRVVGQGLDETSFSKAVHTAVVSGQVESLNTPTVTLSTIHAAKGLEWEHVFVIGLSEGLMPFGLTSRGGGAAGSGLLPGLDGLELSGRVGQAGQSGRSGSEQAGVGREPNLSTVDEAAFAQLEEERRLLYVALTRGKSQVCLSYARRKDGQTGVERQPSRFLRLL